MKYLTQFSLVVVIIQGLCSSSVFGAWLSLELSSLMFFSVMSLKKAVSGYKEMMKLFLIQALSGMVLLISLLLIEVYESSAMGPFASMILVFKMGAVPFHFWLLSLAPKMSWQSLFVFLTLMKLIPIGMLSGLTFTSLTVFGWLGLIISSVSGMYSSSMKHIVVWSSLYTMGMIFLVLGYSQFWVPMMVVYILMFTPILLLFDEGSVGLGDLKSLSGGNRSSVPMMMMMFNMAGLPPFPGFFLKLLWLVQYSIDLLSLSLFFFTSALVVYMYLSFSMKSLSSISFSISNQKQQGSVFPSMLASMMAGLAVIMLFMLSL